MNYELAESSSIETGFVLASPLAQDEEGREYSGDLDVVFVDKEESLAGHFMVLGIMTFFEDMKKWLIIYPKGTFNGTAES
jgi:hypothetical protein